MIIEENIMTKKGRGSTVNKKSKKGLIFVKNTCYINNFTLRVFFDSKESKKNTKNKATQNENIFDPFDYELKTKKNDEIKKQIKFMEEDGKIASNSAIKSGEANLWLKSTDAINTELYIKINLEITDNINHAYKLGKLNQELEEIKDKYQKFEPVTKNQDILDSFLSPHIYGLKNSLNSLNDSIEISYSLNGIYLELFDISNRKLIYYASNNQEIEEESLRICVKINNQELNIYLDENNQWYIEEKYLNKVPTTGNLRIIPKKGNNNSHDKDKFSSCLNSLYKLRDNPNCHGSNILRQVLIKHNENKSTNQSNSIINRQFKEFGLLEYYKDLDSQQKKVIVESTRNPFTIVNGCAGSGKTEVASLFTVLLSLNNKKILVSSEKNKAIDNFLERIDKFNNEEHTINIARFTSRNYDIDIENIKKYDIDNQIESLKQSIIKKCSNSNEDKKLLEDFRKVFRRKRILSSLICMTYDILITTFGMIVSHKLFQNSMQDFDVNIIDASSSTNFSSCSLGLHCSKAWMLLNDKNQVNPLNPKVYLLKQPLRFPKPVEIQHAKKYNPNNRMRRTGNINFGDRKYNSGIASLFKNYKNQAEIKNIELTNQYRIHPELYEIICKAFGIEFTGSNKQKSNLGKMKILSSLIKSKSHLDYVIRRKNEILNSMGTYIANFVDQIESRQNNKDKTITIGVACTDVISLKGVIRDYQMQRYNEIISYRRNYYSDKMKTIEVVFCSIEKHQEREYDVFMLGVINHKSKKFRNRLYTALTRASIYVKIFGPETRKSRIMKTYIQRNKTILAELRQGGK
ncbi:MAG: hypothetical protein GF364_13300 [Candidatus Lokiarchaeota archaeon]|nr:hypothetical protein [Candidatus Lokiarchaeota archaeon]